MAAGSRRKTEGTKYEFKLQLQASRVPMSGWDKLVVALLSIETGRITVKTTRGVVRNGSCQWPDPVVESTRLFRNPCTGECNDKLYRLFVQMGSLRAGILGDATINLAEYVTAVSPETVSLPLRNCTAGTVLHVKIQCLTPKIGLRDFEEKKSGSLDQECPGSASEDTSSSSDISECLTAGSSVGSSASQNLTGLSYLPTSQVQYRKGSVSSSALQRDGPTLTKTLQYSSDGGDNPRDSSPSNRMAKDFANSEVSLFGFEDHLPCWSNSATTRDSCNTQESSKIPGVKYQVEVSNLSIPKTLLQPQQTHSNLGLLPAKKNGAWIASGLPQKLEAAEATIQELREETLLWERQARKLSIEVETFRQQLALESKNGSELKVHILATEAERDSLQSEVKQLKALKGAPKTWGGTDNYSRLEMEESKRTIKALQEEVLYEKEVNANLQVQLSKTQDSNGELLTALTELEETLEASNKVVDKVTEANRKLQEELVQVRGTELPASKTVDDIAVKSTQELVEWQQRLEAAEAILAEKEQKINWLGLQTRERDALKDEDKQLSALKFKPLQKFITKDEYVKELILRLEELQSAIDDSSDLFESSKMWKSILEEQDTDCKELTDEELSFLLKLHRFESFLKLDERAGQNFAAALHHSTCNQSMETCGSTAALKLQVEELERKSKRLEDMVQAVEKEKGELLQEIHKQDVQLKMCTAEITNFRKDSKSHVDARTQLEAEIAVLVAEVDKLALDVADREASLKKLESLLLEANTEKASLGAKIQDLMEERQLTIAQMDAEKTSFSEKLAESHSEIRRKMLEFEEVVEQVASLKTGLDFQLSAKKTLENQMTESSVIKQELEVKVMDLEELNKGLSEEISSLETQLTNTFKDQDQYRHDIEIANAERLDYERKIGGLQSHLTCLEQDLQVATSECSSMQEKCAALETKMMQQQDEFSKKERSLRAEIESLLDCKKNFEQSAIVAEKALIAGQQEKAASVHLLQTKLEQLSLAVDEKEKLAMAKIAELHAEKLELESSLRLMKEKVKELEEELLSQNDLNIKLEDLSFKLDASKNLCNDLTQKLQEKESVLQEQLANQKEQENEIQSRVRVLEEELSQRAHTFLRTEKKLVLFEGDESSKESFGSSNSRHVLELQETLRHLKEEAIASKQQLVICRAEFLQKETELMGKIECLELLNEQLAAGPIDSEAEQLKQELIRLQNQNSFLSRKEQELLSSMHTQEFLQEEVKRLQEANDLLEARLSRFIETAKNPFLPERIINLETELAEAVEANNMYKLQLKRVFDKQQNVSMAALHELGDLDQIVEDLFQYKKKATQLEGELDSMHKRYALISLQLAEAESQRGELMITVKNLKGVKKV